MSSPTEASVTASPSAEKEVLDALAQDTEDDEPITKRSRGRPKGVSAPKDKRPPRSEAQQAAFQKVLANRQAKRERDAEEKQLAAARLLLEKSAKTMKTKEVQPAPIELKQKQKPKQTKKPKILVVQQSESESDPEESEESEGEPQQIVLVKKPSFGRTKQNKATVPKPGKPKPSEVIKSTPTPTFDPRQYFV